ncbi:hypothetical protein JVU11DRAFT_5692 [Chiua virens]|nr:hypothetical protein JVU11DRAFT_5692 [Chiua virens]
MDEIVPNLWIGDLPSALNVESLKAKKIFSVVTAMRGKVTINATFNKCQINIDDSADEDVLVHFLPSISFIQKELDKGRSVLVHCQAGLSRSATIVAAYLMYTRKLDAAAALDMIRAVRPHTDPNEGFLQQLEIFHQASYKISRSSKPVRMFYMERTLEEVMNGDGSAPPNDMFAKYPQTPGSESNTPVIVPNRRIRCKMCRYTTIPSDTDPCSRSAPPRQELATREHMLDHGQLGPPTPALPSLSPARSRRPSEAYPFPPVHSRRPSASLNVTISRRPSINQPRSRLNSGSNTFSAEARPAILAALGGRSLLESLSMSALETEDPPSDVESDADADKPKPTTTHPPSRRPSGSDRPFRPSPLSMEGIGQPQHTIRRPRTGLGIAMRTFGRRTPAKRVPSPPPPSAGPHPSTSTSTSTAIGAAPDLAAQLSANPKFAALRAAASMHLSMTGLNGKALSPPILMNPRCSGYFVEPMKWMDPMLASGALSGKIVCPNKKCGAKIGNYDWAGVCCGCKEWVTPVDEIVV